MCIRDRFVAKSGDSPVPLKEPVPVPDHFLRPQVYPAFVRNIQVPMVPTEKCEVTAVDEMDQPIAGVQVNSYPNVLWWGNGSEVYCARLGRGEDLLVKRDYQLAIDKDVLPYPFQAVTNKQGAAMLDLPLGIHLRLWNESDEYVIPPVLGKQMTERINLVAGQVNRVKLKMKKNVE